MRARATVLALSALLATTPLAAQSPQLAAGGFVGYQGGLTIQAFGTVHDLAEGLPVVLRVRLGRTAVDPGSPAAARRVFINNATTGTPVASGRTWDAGVDVVVPQGPRRRVYVGLRRSSFKAKFEFIGGNEVFDITSVNWGFAGGMEAAFPVTWKVDLVVSGGAEAYLSSRIRGRDTSYSPAGDNVNPRNNYTYHDADKAIGQPKFRLVALAGLSYRFGW